MSDSFADRVIEQAKSGGCPQNETMDGGAYRSDEQLKMRPIYWERTEVRGFVAISLLVQVIVPGRFDLDTYVLSQTICRMADNLEVELTQKVYHDKRTDDDAISWAVTLNDDWVKHCLGYVYAEDLVMTPARVGSGREGGRGVLLTGGGVDAPPAPS